MLISSSLSSFDKFIAPNMVLQNKSHDRHLHKERILKDKRSNNDIALFLFEFWYLYCRQFFMSDRNLEFFVCVVKNILITETVTKSLWHGRRGVKLYETVLTAWCFSLRWWMNLWIFECCYFPEGHLILWFWFCPVDSFEAPFTLSEVSESGSGEKRNVMRMQQCREELWRVTCLRSVLESSFWLSVPVLLSSALTSLTFRFGLTLSSLTLQNS